MDLTNSRFAGQIGTHCPGSKCKTKVIEIEVWTGTRTGRHLVDAAVSNEGNILLRDTSGMRPVGLKLKVADQFGRQGQLHRLHEDYCEAAKRAKARRSRT